MSFTITRERARARYLQVEPGDILYIRLLVWLHNRLMDLEEWMDKPPLPETMKAVMSEKENTI